MIKAKCEICQKYYDAEKYETCPHCAAGSEVSAVQPVVSQELPTEQEPPRAKRHARRPLFHKKKKEEIPAEEPLTEDSVEINEKLRNFMREAMSSDDEATLPMQRVDLEPAAKPVPASPEPVRPKAAAPVKRQDAPPAPPAANPEEPADDRTVAFYSFDPVVGWLVCTAGAYKGSSFELKTGRNGIGRAGDMQIRLDREYSVAAGKHAEVTYEPYKKTFFLQGEGEEATLLNGEKLTQIAELKSFDEIRIGDAAFVFVRLCGSRFSWEKVQ